MTNSLIDRAKRLFQELELLPLDKKIHTLNSLRLCLHHHSPFANEPVDLVQWVPAHTVLANDYNPNSVAPPELRLLELSIESDGFTQPIVSHTQDHQHIVVDGFHRQRVGKRNNSINSRLHGHLPIVNIRTNRSDREHRIASTIRHNRARGIHAVEPMTDIVISLLNAGWSDASIAQHLGMDHDEVLRFKQVAGLPELFKNHNYSPSWE